MLLGDDTLRAIGRLAVLAGHLELSQYLLVGALVGPDPEVREEVARPAENFSVLQNLTRRLSVSRYGEHAYRPEHVRKREVDEWIREAKVLMDERNAVMHGVWGIGADAAPGYLTKRSPHVGRSMTVAELDALGDRIEALDVRSSDLVAAVAADTLARTRGVVELLDGNVE